MKTFEERFWEKVDRSGDCWVWTAATNGRYGVIGSQNGERYAHRAAVILDGREIPDGMEIDHLCRNTLCVRPDDLEVVTPKENCRRIPKDTLPCVIRSRTRTHCGKGHELTPDNVFFRAGENFRRCRTCHRLQVRRHRVRKAGDPSYLPNKNEKRRAWMARTGWTHAKYRAAKRAKANADQRTEV